MKLGFKKKKVYFEPFQKAGAPTGRGRRPSSCVSGARCPRPPSRVAGSTSGSIASDRSPWAGGRKDPKRGRSRAAGLRPWARERPGKRAPADGAGSRRTAGRRARTPAVRSSEGPGAAGVTRRGALNPQPSPSPLICSGNVYCTLRAAATKASEPQAQPAGTPRPSRSPIPPPLSVGSLCPRGCWLSLGSTVDLPFPPSSEIALPGSPIHSRRCVCLDVDADLVPHAHPTLDLPPGF